MDTDQKLKEIKITLEELQNIIAEELTEEHCGTPCITLIEQAIELYKQYGGISL